MKINLNWFNLYIYLNIKLQDLDKLIQNSILLLKIKSSVTMFDKESIEKKLAELFDVVPETEGLIASDLEGNVITGQTITDMDHNGIAKACATLIKNSNTIGENTGKGNLKSATIELENGYAVIVSSDKGILIALAGLDGKASLSLIKRNLISIANL